MIREKKINLRKVPPLRDVSDMGTKFLTADRLFYLKGLIGKKKDWDQEGCDESQILEITRVSASARRLGRNSS